MDGTSKISGLEQNLHLLYFTYSGGFGGIWGILFRFVDVLIHQKPKKSYIEKLHIHMHFLYIIIRIHY